MTTITTTRALLEQALDALEAAKNGLLWYQDTYPDATNDSDDEAMGKIDSALETLRTELAKPPTPAWHDAPTCAGLWLCNYGILEVVCINQPDVDNFDDFYNAGGRWYGPIPQDGGKS